MRFTTRLLSILLAAFIVIGILPFGAVNAFAIENKTVSESQTTNAFDANCAREIANTASGYCDGAMGILESINDLFDDPTEYHTVTYVDGVTEEIIGTENVLHGENATLPTPPEHAGYTFTGWDSTGESITADVTITALYARITYTVTYIDGVTGVTIWTEAVEHGENATPPTPPEHVGYTFTGWDSTGESITADVTITALYARITYTVTYIDGVTGATIGTEAVEYGENATLPTPPVHVGYTFIGWDKTGESITVNTVITAQYAKNSYVVTFVDGLTGKVFSTQTVNHGANATLPEPPKHIGYHFTGWDRNANNIIEPITITALYEKNIYTVTYYDGLINKVIGTERVTYGEDAKMITPPEHEGFSFVRWSADGVNVTSDIMITAQYTRVKYTVTYVDGLTGEIISTELVGYRYNAKLPKAPEHEGYTFIGWDSDGKEIVADTTITAQYTEKFDHGDVNNDGNVNTGDAVTILRMCVGLITLTSEQKLVADYNNDMSVNTGDAVAILRFCVGLKGSYLYPIAK